MFTLIQCSFREKTRGDSGLSCSVCGSSYSRKDTLKKHLKLKHDIELSSLSKRSACTYPGCKETFFHKRKLIEHISNCHKVDTRTETLTFQSESEFLAWKEKEELSNHVYFSKQKGDSESELLKHAYYVCQNDGHSKPHRKSDEPARKTSRKFRRGQIKADKFCPARIIAHTEKLSGIISVEYITSHTIQ